MALWLHYHDEFDMHTWDVIDPLPPAPTFPGVPVPPSPKQPRQITDRMAVPGGWLYRTRVYGEGGERHQPPTVAMVFVPTGQETAFASSGQVEPLASLKPI